MPSHLTRPWKALALAALLGCASCLGPNHATGQLYNWNTNLGNQYVQAGCFLVLSPIYVAFTLGDNLIFNPIQWWSGSNPIAKPDAVDDFQFLRVSDEPLQGATR